MIFYIPDFILPYVIHYFIYLEYLQNDVVIMNYLYLYDVNRL